MIIAEANRFFAEVGFEGQTRALANRLGVTQPLLYRYFPDKEALIERVYAEVFVDSWNDSWSEGLSDRDRPLRDRLVDLYLNYTQAPFSYERVRLFMFATLKPERDIAERYLGFVRQSLFVPLVHEIRAHAHLDQSRDISESEVDCVAGLHGAIGYVGMRHWADHPPASVEMRGVIVGLVATFLEGAPAAFAALSASAP